MRSSIAVLSFLTASVVAASTLQGRQTSPFPPCATACIANADLGGCVASDAACTCKNTKFVDSSTRCILTNCTGDDLTKAITTAQAICKSVGVTLTSTPVLTGSSSSTATSSAASNTATSTSNKSGNGASAARLNTLAGVSALGLVVLPFL